MIIMSANVTFHACPACQTHNISVSPILACPGDGVTDKALDYINNNKHQNV